MTSKRVTTASYLHALDEAFSKGKAGYFSSNAKFPWAVILIYLGVIGLLIALGNIYPLAREVAPLAIITLFVHIAVELNRVRKGRVELKKISKNLHRIKSRVQGCSHLTFNFDGLNLSVKFESIGDIFEIDNYNAKDLILIEMGMGKYIELATPVSAIIAPKPIFTSREFMEVSAPYWDIHKKLTRSKPVTIDELDNLRHQLPFLFQEFGRK
ncbi:MAG: hypothetical protein HQ472_05530 [Ignavibacteria bacterium]|nr:hypothetical protein [Ignavibacteria bacterium]